MFHQFRNARFGQINSTDRICSWVGRRRVNRLKTNFLYITTRWLTVFVLALIFTSSFQFQENRETVDAAVSAEHTLSNQSTFSGSSKHITYSASGENIEQVKVIPGGQSIGVKLHTLGVLVVGHHLVNGKEGEMSPGEAADINVGDIILEIDGEEIRQMGDIKPLVEKAGEKKSSLEVTIKRGKEELSTTLKPVLDSKDKAYKIGLYIRDSAAGIGTMTFYEPGSGKYGALGHIISDMDTKKPIEINEGSIVNSSVTSIEKGNNGVPGEKQARFSSDKEQIGNITKNTPYGIFGKLDDSITNNKYDTPLPVAKSSEVKEGPAKILTVVKDEKVEEYDIEIVNSTPQNSPATKGMVVKITDPELLKRTGGIVQGMSGSPIIQDGKVIGAITHVFVNDPTSGYGVHIEWMLQDAGILKGKKHYAA